MLNWVSARQGLVQGALQQGLLVACAWCGTCCQAGCVVQQEWPMAPCSGVVCWCTAGVTAGLGHQLRSAFRAL